MNMQTRKLAGNQAARSGGICKPVFPTRRYRMMTDIGGIAKKQRGAVYFGKVDRSIVVHQYGEPFGQLERSSVCPQGECGERIDLHRDQFGIGECLSRSEKKTARPRTGIDDAGWYGSFSSPVHHRINDRTRRVYGALFAVHFGPT